MSAERIPRQHPRVEVAVTAEVIFTRDDIVPALTQDLSLGGVRLVLKREIRDGEPLAVALALTEDGIERPDDEPLVLKAVSVWSAEGDNGQWTVGCRFIAVRPAEQARLQAFLDRISA